MTNNYKFTKLTRAFAEYSALQFTDKNVVKGVKKIMKRPLTDREIAHLLTTAGTFFQSFYKASKH